MPLVEHGDAVAHRHRFHLVMGDVNGGGPELALEVNDPRPRAPAQFGVEIAQWFIHQENLWFAGHGPAQGHPLFLSARQFFRSTIEELIQFQRLRHILDALLELLLSMRRDSQRRRQTACVAVKLVLELLPARALLASPQAEGQVVADAQMGVKRIALEHHCHIALGWPQARHGLVPHQDLA